MTKSRHSKININRRIAIIIAACVTVVGLCVAAFFLWPRPAEPVALPNEPTPVLGKYAGPEFTVSGWLVADVDYPTANTQMAKQSVDRLLEASSDYGINSLIVPLNSHSGVIYNSQQQPHTDFDYLSYIIERAHSNMIAVYAVYDLSSGGNGSALNLCDGGSVESLLAEVENICASYQIDGILFDNYYTRNPDSYRTYYERSGSGMGLEAFCRDKLSVLIRSLSQRAISTKGSLLIGAVADSVLYTTNDRPDGINLIEGQFNAYADGLADVAAWVDSNYVNFLLVRNYIPGDSFNTVTQWWRSRFKSSHTVFSLAADKADGWEDDGALCGQYAECVSGNSGGAAFYTLSELDGEGSSARLKEYILLHGDPAEKLTDLIMTTPSATEFTVNTDTLSFIGSSDPSSPLTCNGKAVERTRTGYFSFDATLKEGKNSFKFEHKGKMSTYTVTYINAVIKQINPSGDRVEEGGVQIVISATARSGAVLDAHIGNSHAQMTEAKYSGNDSAASAMYYSTYTALFTLPDAKPESQVLGQLVITAKYGGKDYRKTAGTFTVRGSGNSGGSSAGSQTSSSTNTQFIPGIGSYQTGYGIEVGVGDRYVCEVKGYQVTTLDGGLLDNRSRPTNAYLPAGTVDYCTDRDAIFYDPDSGNRMKFRTLDYGKRIINDSDVAIFKATLPETNSITAASVTDTGRHMVVTFDTQWKAPFNVTYGTQEYKQPYPQDTSRPDYTIENADFTYVDIEFCYTVSSQGRVIPTEHSVFSSAEWVKNKKGNYVLRLHLKQAGSFYGWSAQYNELNQLEFHFLNPAKVEQAENEYGATLYGVTVMLDAGHGGSDPGAVGSSSKYTEAVLNLTLTNKIKRELEAIGATVILTRSDDRRVSLDERAKLCYAAKPDIFVSVHRNSSESSSAKGYENYYFYPFSKCLADAIHQTASECFTKDRGVRYYPFRVTRMSCCPTVLTENGYVSNGSEMELIKSDAHNEQLAKATVQGIVDYFMSIQ